MRKVEERPTFGGRKELVFTDEGGKEWRTRELADELGLTPRGLLVRLKTEGVERDGFWARPNPDRQKPRVSTAEYCHLGVTGSVRFWADRLGISKQAFLKRLRRHGPFASATFDPPVRRGE